MIVRSDLFLFEWDAARVDGLAISVIIQTYVSGKEVYAAGAIPVVGLKH